MTIDEAIKHANEVADLCEYEASKYDMTDAYESHVACQEGKCAEEHRQLAEWLKELKQLREQTRWVPVSEKLPGEDGDEEDGEYLLFGKIDEVEENHTFIGEYDSCSEQFGFWQEEYDRSTLGCLGSEFYEYASVIAWMPIKSYVHETNVGNMAESEE